VVKGQGTLPVQLFVGVMIESGSLAGIDRIEAVLWTGAVQTCGKIKKPVGL
jgi:hypothetical protein